MRSLLLGAALPVLLLTSALACDFNREARQDQPTVVADCTGSGCMVSDPTDKTVPEPSAAYRRAAPADPVQDCTGSNCKKPDPVRD
ncbi:MAG TPA: hypothetical protein VNZ53_44585 [Steroidobacteraceae bacterium]|jgi:hypothetical protein|nr:hypothetical protein [Steroidobacteraceae bacterium]